MTDMSKQTEALKLAEDALKRVRTQDMELVQMSMIALAAIQEALAEQPAQQEPVAMLFGSLPVYDKPAQQEPVAWLRKSDLVELRACNYMRLGADSPSIWAPNAPDEPSPDMELVAVYTSPPAQRTWVNATTWRGLTDEEM